ncbi:MAG: glutamate--tRNA ligase [Alphaproteobacteria bacterium]|nr:glutamate--tRNA ligase [Alphaproteobacteria bacterium]
MVQAKSIVTRFAPSPTGFLHIGGARTALFNWLYARRHGGTFRLRIEDTDRQRSTNEAIEALIEGLTWLELGWDGEIVYQFARAQRHAEVAHTLLKQGLAYHCYATAEELEAMREAQKAAGKPVRYDGRWRDRPASDARPNVPPVVRIKAPQTGETVIADKVQGEVRFDNDVLDDFVLLRSDGTPTYMLSVVVDDFDMGITHVIRGDDHLTNAARQRQIIDSMGWPQPVYAHLPLLHGEDGAKLSKRHGALGIHEYEALGYLPEAMRNYLLRLGWSHGDDEVIATEQAIAWFDLEHIGRSPARIDLKKLDNLNGHYLRAADNERLADLLCALRRKKGQHVPGGQQRDLLVRAMNGLKERAKTMVELNDNSSFLFAPRPLSLDEKAAKILSPAARALLAKLAAALAATPWDAAALEAAVRAFAETEGVKLGDAAQPLRAALTGKGTSPPIFDVMAVLGREECLARIADQDGIR